MRGVVPPPDERINDWTQLARLLGRIIPISRTKKPLKDTKRQDAAEPSVDLIRSLLTEHGAYGIWLRDHVVVVDVDSDAAKATVRERGLPPTVMVRTGRGYHLVFADPSGRLRGRRSLVQGLDLVAHHGAPWFVVGAGSIHARSDTRYEIVDGRDLLASGTIPVAPQWLYEMVDAAAAARAQHDRVANIAPEKLDAIAATFAGAAGGGRHHALLQFAIRLRGCGAGAEELSECCAAAAQKCTPPFTKGDERRELAAMMEWVLRHIRPGRPPDILTLAIRYARRWPARVSGRSAWKRLVSAVMFLGESPDPVFALPQLRLAKALGCSQPAISGMIKQLLTDRVIVVENGKFVPNKRSKTYRLSARSAEPRPARLSRTIAGDTHVRVVWDDQHQAYVAMPLPKAAETALQENTYTTRKKHISLSMRPGARRIGLALGFVPPSPEEIADLIATHPYAGPVTDFTDGVLMSALRSRRPPRQSPARPTATAIQSRCGARPSHRRAPGPHARSAASVRQWGPADPVAAAWSTVASWAGPALTQYVKRVAPLVFTRPALIEILRQAWERIETSPDAIGSTGLALALNVLLSCIKEGRTAVWWESRTFCDTVAATIAGDVPRARRLDDRGVRRWFHPQRPTVHQAVAILWTEGLVTPAELRSAVRAPVRVIKHVERETGVAVRHLIPSGASGWPFAYSFTLQEIRIVLTRERTRLFRVRDKRARGARAILIAEVRRAGLPVPDYLTHHATCAKTSLGIWRWMSVHDAIHVLGENGAADGLGRRISGVPSTSCA